jgi:predicted Zn-dependent protease
MKSLKAFKHGLAKVKRDWLARRYDRALAEVNRLLQEWPDNPHLLVTWADLIQLQDSHEGPTLAEAKAAYQRATELDSESPAPLVELGHFLYALDDDATTANKAFSKAISLCKNLLTEALVGQAKALTELGFKSEALACLAEAYWYQSHNAQTTNGKVSKEILERLLEVAQTS